MERSPQKQITLLPEEVASKIAAGEVIDRPEAAVRELLDNAIDSGAPEIILELNKGGLDEIRIRDNGRGMTRNDLKLCWQRHATSKISKLEDLDILQTLGFRGEALASLASCSRMEITSAPASSPAHRLSVHGGKFENLEAHPAPTGTTVSIKNLFYNMPARKQFLKSPRLESSRCRRIFSEKAAAHPHITFRLFLEKKLSLYLPPATLTQRILSLWPRPLPNKQSCLIAENHQKESTLSAILGRPEIHQKNRRYIHIYVNGRHIEDFSLVQAIQYAYEPWLPGGLFPVAFLFLKIPPRQVDFNIHPAKREVRFREIETIRQWIITSLKDSLAKASGPPQFPHPRSASGDFTADSGKTRLRLHSPPPDSHSPDIIVRDDFSTYTPHLAGRNSQQKSPSTHPHPPSGTHRAADRPLPYAASRHPDSQNIRPPSPQEAAAFARTVTQNHPGILQTFTDDTSIQAIPTPFETIPAPSEIHYLGQTLGVFLLAECRSTLYIVDQHAAHERLIFNRLQNDPHIRQKLLLPRPLQLEREALLRLETRLERLEELGITVETSLPGEPGWQLTAIPQNASHLEDEIVQFLESGAGDTFGLEKALWASLACKAAVKDNNTLNDSAAHEILHAVFSLENPRCPHGRPLWFSLNREQLFSLVQRKI